MHGTRKRLILLIRKIISFVLIIQLACPLHVRAMNADEEGQNGVGSRRSLFSSQHRSYGTDKTLKKAEVESLTDEEINWIYAPDSVMPPPGASSVSSSSAFSSSISSLSISAPFPHSLAGPSSSSSAFLFPQVTGRRASGKQGPDEDFERKYEENILSIERVRMKKEPLEPPEEDRLPLLNARSLPQSMDSSPDALTHLSRGVEAPFESGLPCTSTNVPLSVRHEDNALDLFAFLHDSPVDSFAQTILEVTGAEPDVPRQVRYALDRAISKINEEHDDLLSNWHSRRASPCWRDPEGLVDRDRIEHLLRAPSSFSQSDEAFGSLRDALTELASFKEYLEHPSLSSLNVRLWQESLQRLSTFYTDYQDKIIKAQTDSGDKSEHLSDLLSPKAVLMGAGVGSWRFYRISQLKARQMICMRSNGAHFPMAQGQSHHVSYLPPSRTEAKVYFKLNEDGPLNMQDLSPGREEMVQSLYEQLDIPMAATRILFIDRIQVNHAFIKTPLMLQASQAVRGIAGGAIFTDKQEEDTIPSLALDPYGKQLVGALLSDPSDGKPHNFIYHPETQGLISIDNDQVFEDSLTSKGYVRILSILYMFPDMMRPFSPSIQAFCRALIPEVLTLSYVKELENRNRSYYALKDALQFQLETRALSQDAHNEGRSREEVSAIKEAENKKVKALFDAFSLPIQISEVFMEKLFKKTQAIQKLFLSRIPQTGHDLLCHLNPLLGVFYAKLREKHPNPYTGYYDFLKSKRHSPKVLDLVHPDTPLVGGKTAQQHLSEQIEDSKIYNTQDRQKISPAEGQTLLLFFFKETEGNPENSGTSRPLLSRWIEARLMQMKDLGLKDLIASKDWTSTFKTMSRELSLLTHHGFLRLDREKDAFVFWEKGRHLFSPEGAWDSLFDSIAQVNPHLDFWLAIGKVSGPVNSKAPPHLLCVEGAMMGERIFTSPVGERLFTQESTFCKDSTLPGRSDSTCYPQISPELYFKKNPELPGFEYAATSFMRRFGIHNAPVSEVFKFYDAKDKVFYPVLVSRSVPGNVLYKEWHQDALFRNLDPHHTHLLILASMLLNPEDAKSDNFILSPDGKYLIPIDNDHSFLPGAIREERGLFSTIYEQLQSKSVVFCLPQMTDSLPDSVRTHISSLNVKQFLEGWAHDLVKINDRYESLFPPEQLTVLWKEKGSTLRMPFPETFLKNLYFKFHRLQTLISEDPHIRPLTILKVLEPFVGECYKQASISGFKTVQERFDAVTKALYKRRQEALALQEQQQRQNQQGASSASSFSSSATPFRAPHESITPSVKMMRIMNVPDSELIGLTPRLGPDRALEIFRALSAQTHASPNFPYSPHSVAGRIEIDCRPSALSPTDERTLLSAIFETDTDPLTTLILKNTSILTKQYFEKFSFKDRATHLQTLNLEGSRAFDIPAFVTLYSVCPNLVRLTLDRCPNLTLIAQVAGFSFFGNVPLGISQAEFPCLKRLSAKGCASLTEIRLSSPKLTHLDIEGSDALKELWLNGEKMNEYIKKGTVNGEKISEAVISVLTTKDLEKEETFYLRNGRLTSTAINLMFNPRELSVNLAKIDLWRELMRGFPAKGVWSALTTIDLNGNDIGEEGASALAQAIESGNVPALTSLNLGSSIGRLGAATITRAIGSGKLPALSTVNLHNNHIGKVGASFVARVIELGKIPVLTSLNLGGNDIGYAGASALARVIKLGKTPALTDIKLRGNNIREEGASALAQAIESGNIPALTSVDLNSNHIGDMGASAIVHAIGSGKTPAFVSIDLDYNNIGNTGASNIARVIKLGKTLALTSIKLCGNSIGDVGTDALAQAIESGNVPALTSVDLNSNHIGDMGASALARVIELGRVPFLSTVDLGVNNVGYAGAFALARVIRLGNVPALTALNLQRNNIGDKGSSALAQAIGAGNVPALTSVNLSSNSIGYAGANDLSIGLGKVPLLSTINLRSNVFGDAGVTFLAQAIESGKTPALITVDLRDNHIGETGTQAMRSAGFKDDTRPSGWWTKR